MKFKIRYADQIVGLFSLIALGALLVFIFSIGATQNWFVKKNNYHTFFNSGSGFSVGMDITYKGFSIGKIKSVKLEGDMVRVDYYVLSDYASYVHENSLVELITSPIGLGSSFVLHPGNSQNLIPDNSEIYRLDSGFGKEFVEKKLVRVESQSDSIGVLMNKVSFLLDNVNSLLGVVNDAARGKGQTPLKEIVGNLNVLLENLGKISRKLSEASAAGSGIVPELLGRELSAEVDSLLGNLQEMSTKMNNLIGQLSPEVMNILAQVNSTLVQVQDVLSGVKNNPLIRSGIPDRSTGDSSTAQFREMDF